LFFQVPENHHYVSHSVISPHGKILGTITTSHNLVCGKAESAKIYQNPGLDELTTRFTEKIARSGWAGFLNLQCKPDRSGTWKVFEMNPRMAGASSARLILGFDEIGKLINAFYPGWDFPDLSRNFKSEGIIHKSLEDHYILSEDIRELTSNLTWHRNRH